jgi:hypothetical protein
MTGSATKQSKACASPLDCFALLAMTRTICGAPFIRPRDSGGGGPPAGRWRGRGLAVHSAVVACSLPAMLKTVRSFSSLSRLATQWPPPPHFVWSPSPVSRGRKAKMIPRRGCVRVLPPPRQCKDQKPLACQREGSGAPRDASDNVRRARAHRGAGLRLRRMRATDTLLAQRLRVGRARLPAHRCGSRQGFDLLTQLQAMLPGMFARRALPARSQPQCRDSTSRRGPSAAGRDAQSRPGAVCETARRHRIPLHNQDRIRNAPLDERDSLQ